MKIIAVYTQLKQLSIYCDDLHLLKMYFPQYKYMTFMYSYHINFGVGDPLSFIGTNVCGSR